MINCKNSTLLQNNKNAFQMLAGIFVIVKNDRAYS